MSADLLIMAAGMGSRFGGLKQAAPMGPNGEMLIDYSVYDAKQAGFERAVIIIRKDIEHDFREACGKRIEQMIDTHYVFQEKSMLPDGFVLPEGRVKPWGTGHAVLCAKEAVKNPFLVIKADDFYGASVYKAMYEYLSKNDGMCMAGYKLGNTLSENGTVCRGVCTVENGYLKDIKELTDIPYDTELSHDTIVSMNMWGLDLGIFEFLGQQFNEFLTANINEPKKEFFLPEVINSRINQKQTPVKVIETNEQWKGVTYPDDAAAVRAAIDGLVANGQYRGMIK